MFTLSGIFLSKPMYRQTTMSTENKLITEKLTELPIVSYTWGQAYDLYQKTKEYNSLVKSTLEMTETGIKTVAEKSIPYVEKYKPQLETVNSYACQQLDKLQENYPSIKRPADEILADGKNLVQPTVDKISSIKDYSTTTYTNNKEKVTNVVTGIKDYGMTKATQVYGISEQAVNKTLETSMGKMAVGSVNAVLDKSETLIDHYLPEDLEKEENGVECDEIQPVDDQTTNPVVRAVHIGSKLRQRMVKKASNDFSNVKMRSEETIKGLTFTVNLIEYAKTNVDSAKMKVQSTVTATQEKLINTWHEINTEPTEEEQPATTEGKVILMAKKLTHRLKSSAVTMSTYLPVQPDAIKQQIDVARKYSDDIIASFKNVKSFDDLSTWTLTQTKEKVAYIQQIWSSVSEQIIGNALDMVGTKQKLVKEEDEEMEMESL